jgi:hypothetical protein
MHGDLSSIVQRAHLARSASACASSAVEVRAGGSSTQNSVWKLPPPPAFFFLAADFLLDALCSGSSRGVRAGVGDADCCGGVGAALTAAGVGGGLASSAASAPSRLKSSSACNAHAADWFYFLALLTMHLLRSRARLPEYSQQQTQQQSAQVLVNSYREVISAPVVVLLKQPLFFCKRLWLRFRFRFRLRSWGRKLRCNRQGSLLQGCYHSSWRWWCSTARSVGDNVPPELAEAAEDLRSNRRPTAEANL